MQFSFLACLLLTFTAVSYAANIDTRDLHARIAPNNERACRGPKNANQYSGQECRFYDGDNSIEGQCRKPYGVKELTCHTGAELANTDVSWEPAWSKELIGVN